MTHSREAGGSRQTRRRGAALEVDILDAAWLELADVGYEQFRIASVATRAGTGKAAIYRRWPDRIALIRAAAIHSDRRRQRDPMPVTGDLRADLIAALARVAGALAGPYGKAARSMVAAREQPQGVEGTSRRREPTRIVTDVLNAPEHAGAVDASKLDVMVIDLGPTLVGHHFLLHGAPPDMATIADIVDLVWMPLLSPRDSSALRP